MRDAIPTDSAVSAAPLTAAGATKAHVDVRLRSHGDDAWRRDHIECTAWSAELPGFTGSIDAIEHHALTLARL